MRNVPFAQEGTDRMPKTKEELEAEKAEQEAERAAAEEERLGKMIDARLNKAISTHLKREMPKLAETIGASVLASMQKAREEETEASGEGGAAAASGEGAGKGKAGGGEATLPPEVEKRIRALEKVTKDAERRAQEAEARAKEMEDRRRLDEENDLSTKALLGIGIKDEVQLESALLFHRGKGRIKRDDDGKPVFVRKGRDGDEETVPLEQGLKEWAKTEEAKRFLPATNAAGSGSQGARNGAAAGGKGGGKTYGDGDFFRDIMGGFGVTVGGGDGQS